MYSNHAYNNHQDTQWGRANKTTLLPLIGLQNKAVRTTLKMTKLKQQYLF